VNPQYTWILTRATGQPHPEYCHWISAHRAAGAGAGAEVAHRLLHQRLHLREVAVQRRYDGRLRTSWQSSSITVQLSSADTVTILLTHIQPLHFGRC